MIIDVNNISEYRNYIDDIIINYCIDNDIDTNNIYPTVFNYILMIIYEKTYAIDIELLRDIPNKYNQYNQQKVYNAYIVLKSLCNKYQMEISLARFCTMTGIDRSLFYEWLNHGTFNILEKIMVDNEESLSTLMQDRRNNPMKYLPKLNKVHEWNMPGVRNNDNKSKSIGFNDLPILSKNSNNLQLDNFSHENEIVNNDIM